MFLLSSDVTVSCSDVRVVAESCTHTADVSRATDVERRIHGRAGRAVTTKIAGLGLASPVPANCRSTTARRCTGRTPPTDGARSPNRLGIFSLVLKIEVCT